MVNLVDLYEFNFAHFDESVCQFGRVVKAIDSNFRYQFRSRAHVRIMQLTFHFWFSFLVLSFGSLFWFSLVLPRQSVI